MPELDQARHTGRRSFVRTVPLELIALCSSLLLTAAASTVLAQAGVSEDADERAHRAFVSGRDAYAIGHFSEALASFQRSYELSARPDLLYNIGRAAEAAWQIEVAIDAYQRYLQARPSAENLDFVQARLTTLREQRALASAPARTPDVAPEPEPAPSALAFQPRVRDESARQDTPADDATGLYRSGHFAIKLGVDFAGQRSLRSRSREADPASNVLAPAMSEALAIGFGASAAYVLPVHDYFALGGLLGLAWWRSDEEGDGGASRNLLLDLAVYAEGRYLIANALQVYVAVLPGIGLDRWSALGSRNIAAPSTPGQSSFGLESNTAIGFGLGALIGARRALIGSFGVMAELGFRLHTFSHELTASLPLGRSAKASVTLQLVQFGANVGVIF